MENRRPISYSLEDIKRYQQGLMTREEMHAFEKASMEDPFLADALEGFMNSDMALAEEHLSNIKERITAKEEQKEKGIIVSMPRNRFGFMRVAAMIIVIAGAGLLTYKILDKEEITPTEQIAETKPPITEIKPGTNQSAAPLTSDSEKTTTPAEKGTGNTVTTLKGNVASGDYPSTDIATSEVKTTPRAMANMKQEKEDVALSTDKIKPAKEPLPVVEEAVSANTYTYTQGRNKIQNNQIRGRVLTPNNQPLANANIQLDNSRKYIVTDAEGNFHVNAKDSVVLATVASNGFMDTRVQLRSNTENTINIGNILLQADPTFENSIVVTGLGTTKKQRIADTLSSKPEGGWESFQQYVANQLNIQLDTTGSDMKITGEMVIEFFVDANGNPKDFKVLNSTNPVFNQHAIDAVKQGPKWATRKKKARILIRY